MSRLIDLRKLAVVDLTLPGPRFILAEFAVGVLGALIFAYFVLRNPLILPIAWTWNVAIGLWLVGIAIHYVPLFLYALDFVRADRIDKEGTPELARVGRYTVQQTLVSIPFLFPFITLFQEMACRHARLNECEVV